MTPKEIPVHRSGPVAGFALWQLGFRPFYLLASLYGALSAPLWALEYSGNLPWAYLRSPAAHGHEMIFGFTLAVLAGFLFTAVRTWTGQPTPAGRLLAAYAGLWLAGRLLLLTPFGLAAAFVSATFPLAVAAGIAVPLVRSRNRRNYFFIALLMGLAAADLAVELSARTQVPWSEDVSLHVGLDLLLFIMAVMGGRVIPMFTHNAIPGIEAKRHVVLEKIALGGILVLLGADLLQLRASVIAAIALVLAVAHGLRLYQWQTWRTLSKPLVWILHAAYGWIVVHLALRACASLQIVAEPLADHALTIGAIGGLTIGMMTRTARGHTGRPLNADGFESTCFVLVQVAAAIRVFGAMLAPTLYLETVLASAACWSGAFALYAVRYWPVLTRARIDGRPG